MEDGPRKKPPPPPPAAIRQTPARAAPAPRPPQPSAEGILVGSPVVSAKAFLRLQALLPPALQNSLSADSQGRIFAGGAQIGVKDGSRLLIEYGPLFQKLQFPPAMRAMVQATGMKIFIEVTESEACICAGDRPGQKKIYSRIS